MRAIIDGVADLGEMILHGFGVAIGKHKAGTFPLLRADRSEDVRPHGSLIQRCRRPGSPPCPSSGDFVLLAYARFVCPPDFDVRALRELGFDGCQCGGEVFLKASPSTSFCA